MLPTLKARSTAPAAAANAATAHGRALRAAKHTSGSRLPPEV